MRSPHVIDGVFGEARQAGELTSLSRPFRRPGWTRSERVLLVEPDDSRRAHLRDVVRELADITGAADFLTARTRLFSKTYDWLITNFRLGAHNGLHLAHLAGTSRMPIRLLIYADRPDLWLIREAQRVGAFYEACDRIDRALPAYLRAALPQQDRRNPAEPDRRLVFRGSRRCTELLRGQTGV